MNLSEYQITQNHKNLNQNYLNYVKIFFDFLKYEKNASKHTIRAYLNDITFFFNYLQKEQIDILEVNQSIIRSYFINLNGINFFKNKTERNISAKYQKRILSTLRTFYKLLKRKKLITNNPILMNSPRIKRKIPEFFKPKELEMIFDFFNHLEYKNKKQKALFFRDKAIFGTLYSSGMRISELIQIKLNDITVNINGENSIKEEIKIRGKRNKERLVYLGSFAIKAIQDYLNYRNFLNPTCDLVFINSKGGTLTDRGIRHRMNFYQRKIGILSKIYPHKFRHTIATDLLREGVDLRIIQEFLGHENLSTTQIYTHVSKDKIKEIYRYAHPLEKNHRERL